MEQGGKDTVAVLAEAQARALVVAAPAYALPHNSDSSTHGCITYASCEDAGLSLSNHCPQATPLTALESST
jgi:hypothetical protein